MNVREGFVTGDGRMLQEQPQTGFDDRLPQREQPQAGPEVIREAQPAPHPAPAQAPPRNLDTGWPITVKLLHKPIRNANNELVHELIFREPTGGDINRYGNPTRITLDGDVAIDEQKMMRIMAALSGYLLPLLEAMDPRDWNSCAYRLRNFFLPDLGAW